MTCELCNDTKLIPFVKKGKVIPDVWLDCECMEPEVDDYREIKLEDFDYPMSDTFRALSYEYCGIPDPARQPKPMAPIVVDTGVKHVVHHHQHVTSSPKRKYNSYD